MKRVCWDRVAVECKRTVDCGPSAAPIPVEEHLYATTRNVSFRQLRIIPESGFGGRSGQTHDLRRANRAN